MNNISNITALFMCSLSATAQQKPNILLVMVDDMGYSDIGCYGGEINTPVIDQLAGEGMRFTHFYNGARSCPTRASLITGQYAHQAGIGWMVDLDCGIKGYQGDLAQDVATIPEMLQTGRYKSYLAGKWHVVHKKRIKYGSDNSNWPLQRGFDNFWGILHGSASYYNTNDIFEGNNPWVPSPEESFFLTDKIAEKAAGYIQSHTSNHPQQPFFLYLAFTAPHWPLHAREKTIQKYLGIYEKGWDVLRAERINRMLELNIVPFNTSLTQRDPEAPVWNKIEETEKTDMIRRMATYAAMIEEIDTALGQVIETLKESGAYDNTLIIFLSDNGGCAEHISSGEDKSTEAIGTTRSFESYRLPWANLSNTPFKQYKHFTHEGGIATPLIACWKGKILPGTISDQPGYLIDLITTFAEISGTTYPETRNGLEVNPPEGISLIPAFKGEELPVRYMYWEHEAHRAIRYNNWKLVSKGNKKEPYEGEWELYDLDKDRSESNNKASEYPQIVKQLADEWQLWAEKNHVLPLDGSSGGERIKRYNQK